MPTRAGLTGRFTTFVEAVRLVVGAARRPGALVLAVQLISGVIGAATLWSVGQVIDGLAEGDPDWSATWPWIAVLAALTAAAGVLGALARELQGLIAELVHRRTSERVINAAAAVPFERFDFGAFYDRLARAIAGASASATAIVWGALGATKSLIDGFFVGVILLAVAPVVVPIAVAAYIPLAVSSRFGNQRFHRFLWAQTEGDRRRLYLASLFGQRDPGREVRMYGLGRSFGAWHSDLWDERIDRLRSLVRVRLGSATVGSLLASALTAVALGLVAWLATRGELSLSEAGVGILAVHRLSGVARQLNLHLASLDQGSRQMQDYDEFVAAAEAEHEGDGEGRGRVMATPPTRVDTIDLADVHFTYPNATTPALAGVDLTLHAGEVVALVGPNGSGKSTIAMLLCGLYRPERGQVCWDGTDIAGYEPTLFRAQIATMFQEFTRYRLSARDNIAVSDFPARGDNERIAEALRQAGGQGVVERLDRGLETELSTSWEEGTELSAGQWQRLAAARAMFRPAPLLILDEPTADLDALAEQELLTELREVARAGTCVLLVSHRFSAIRRADRIVVLDAGHVVEQGTHDELVATAGLYATMHRTQTGGGA